MEKNLFDGGDVLLENEDEKFAREQDELESLLEGDEESEIDISDVENHYMNLAEVMGEEDSQKIVDDVIEDIEEAKNSRSTWEDNLTRTLNSLGIVASQSDADDSPIENGCDAHHPLILEATIKFQSKASAEMLPPDGPARTKVFGDHTEETLQIADRIKTRLNYQTTVEMPEYYTETEKALFCTGLLGDAFKRKYYDADKGRIVDEMLPPTRVLVNNAASNLQSADSYTLISYMSKRDMDVAFHNGLFIEEDIGEPTKPELSKLEAEVNRIMGIDEIGECYTLYEHYCYLTLDHPYSPTEVPRPLPYIAYIEANSKKLLALQRNWEPGEDSRYQANSNVSHYQFVPWFGMLGLGYAQLLGNWQKTLTTITRSLVDAGQFSNMPAGFKSKFFKAAGNDFTISPGKFIDVESMDEDLRKSIMPLPFKEPSSVLFNILGFLDSKGEKFASSADAVAESGSNYGPVGTTLALLDASGKTEAAVHKRLHNSQKQELGIILALDKLHDKEEIKRNNGDILAYSSDYGVNGIEIVPVSDPNISSQAHRLSLAQARLNLASQFTNELNPIPILRNVLALLGTNEQEMREIFPDKEEAKPSDPISDIMKAVKREAIVAVPGQNHDAHVSIKQSWLNDPQNGGNEVMAHAREAIMTNIQEHKMLKYQEQLGGMIQQQGVNEGNIEMAMAQAAQEIQEFNKSNEYTGTPEEILAKVEERKVAIDEFKAQKDYEIDKQKQEIDVYKIMSDLEVSNSKLVADLEKFLLEQQQNNEQFSTSKVLEFLKEKRGSSKE